MCHEKLILYAMSQCNEGADRSIEGMVSNNLVPYIVQATGPDASWRWNCCSCSSGNNLSYNYDASCVECGHTRRDSCCEVYVSR
ncbi:hypothetical protein F4806DRAFT_482510 [Annulohypoxylon nitens]|nr:hypothetical protein F4806DRAFT_482510 [Annulohypoxylon nitens]